MPAIKQLVLNAQEMEICKQLAKMRLDHLADSASGRNWTELNDVDKEAVGFMGELGFCKMFNVYFHMDIVPDKDVAGKRGDARFGDHLWVDVKTLTKHYPRKRLIVPKKPVEEYVCDIYALCSASENVVTFFGFMRKEHLIVPARLDEKDIPYPGYVADEYELYPALESVL
jgi:hypothetical protein